MIQFLWPHMCIGHMNLGSITVSITESKLILFPTQQANKLRDEVLEGIVTLLRRLTDDGGLVSQRTILELPSLNLGFFYTKKGENKASCCKLLGGSFLCSCKHLPRSGHNVFINLQKGKYYSPLCKF